MPLSNRVTLAQGARARLIEVKVHGPFDVLREYGHALKSSPDPRTEKTRRNAGMFAREYNVFARQFPTACKTTKPVGETCNRTAPKNTDGFAIPDHRTASGALPLKARAGLKNLKVSPVSPSFTFSSHRFGCGFLAIVARSGCRSPPAFRMWKAAFHLFEPVAGHCRDKTVPTAKLRAIYQGNSLDRLYRHGAAALLPCGRQTPRFRAEGAVAQLGERIVRNDEARGSIPIGSTRQIKWLDENGIGDDQCAECDRPYRRA